MKTLKEVSKVNFIWGLINVLLSFPILAYGFATVMRIEHNKKPMSEYILDFLLDPKFLFFYIPVILNLMIDISVYKNSNNYKMKLYILPINLCFFLYIFYISIDNKTPIFFPIFLFLITCYKIYKYYQYYKLTTTPILNWTVPLNGFFLLKTNKNKNPLF